MRVPFLFIDISVFVLSEVILYITSLFLVVMLHLIRFLGLSSPHSSLCLRSGEKRHPGNEIDASLNQCLKPKTILNSTAVLKVSIK